DALPIYAEEDKKIKDKVDKLNSADATIFSTEKQLKEYGDKIPADKKTAIENALEDLKSAHKAEDLDKIDAATASVTAAWTAASQDIYQANQSNGAQTGTGPESQGGQDGTGAGGSSQGADDVTDVEFEEVDENK